jgi:hypothetical protein
MLRFSLVAVATLLGASTVAAQDNALVAKIVANFRNTCTTCHQPPDLKFATDRAWLDQVYRTS